MRIACVLGPGFEDSEFRVPYDRFRQAGHEVTVIGVKQGERLAGKNGKETFTAERAVAGADASRFDALFIPGGHSPDQLRGDPAMVEFVRAFRDKPIFAICHGPQLLITAGLVKDRKMTAWKTIQVDLRHAGAAVADRDVVVDGNLVTSRQPEDLGAFVRESLGLLSAGANSGAHV